MFVFFSVFDRFASVTKAHLKFCRIKFNLCVVVLAKGFILTVSFRLLKHPTKIMIWSVISGKGTGRLYVVKGAMNQDQYKDVLQNRLIRSSKNGFQMGYNSFSCKMELPATQHGLLKHF